MQVPLIVIALAIAGQGPSCDTITPPPPPRLEQLAGLRTKQDVVGVAVLADGSRAPSELVLPTLVNRRQTLEYMRVNYPDVKKRKNPDARPVAWLCVDRKGHAVGARLLRPTGETAFDELSLKVFAVASFVPGIVGADTVEVWIPLPAFIPPKEELEFALAADQIDHSTQPANTPFTDPPVLMNRARIEAAILRVIYNVNPAAVQRNESFYRAQQIGGTTIMWVYIDPAGVVKNTVVKKSSGNTDLDNSAQQISLSMQFMPAKLNGKPVEAWIEVPFAFRAR